jgi:hypothetical protein
VLTGKHLQDSLHEAVETRRDVVVAIHQPNYIPWLGYFFKIAHADKFVFLDTVKFPTPGFVNRNSIKTRSGAEWLTIPVIRTGRSSQSIAEVETDRVQPWRRRHLMALRSNYGKAPHFKETFALLELHYKERTGSANSLAGFNIGLIRAIASYLMLSAQFVLASDLKNVSGQKTDLIRDICLVVGGTSYLAGTGAKSYQEDAKLEEVGITPLYSTFSSPTYLQRFGEFIPNLSIVDVLMNCGGFGTRKLLGIDSKAAK